MITTPYPCKEGTTLKAVQLQAITAAKQVRAIREVILEYFLLVSWGKFNKTFTRVIYKCNYCSQTLKQWLHL